MSFKRKRANKYLKIYNMNQKIKANVPTYLALREQISNNQVEFYGITQKLIKVDDLRGKALVDLACNLSRLEMSNVASHSFAVMALVVLVPFLHKLFLG